MTGYPLIAQTLVEREVTVNTAEKGVTATATKLVPFSAMILLWYENIKYYIWRALHY